MYGAYMPDGIDLYQVGDQTYIVTANEGDSRDWDGYSEEARVADLELCADAPASPATTSTSSRPRRTSADSTSPPRTA
ncbi:hypothetical protein GCM10029992_20180 [Glycomyces albus]